MLDRKVKSAVPKRLLIVLLGAIGDVTRALPLATRIKADWPETHLAWAVEPKSQGILEGHPAVDQIIVFDRARGLPAYLDFIKRLRSERFDLVLDLQRHFKSGITSVLSGARRRIGFNRKNAKEFNWLFNSEQIEFCADSVPKILHYQRFGDHLGLDKSSSLDFGLKFSAAEQERADQLIKRAETEAGLLASDGERKRVALLIGASWSSKLWPVKHYVQLVRLVEERLQWSCYLIGGKAELDLARSIRDQLGDYRVADLVGRTTLRELGAVLSQFDLAVGSDSGPMHIAAAVGLRVISLWGATDPVRTGPYGSESLVLQSPIGCAPCYRRECPGLGTLCMSDISSEVVMARILGLVEQDKRGAALSR